MLAKFIYFSVLGWKVKGTKNIENVNRAVIIAAPHTSWHDFYIGALFRSAIKLKANFIAKKSLFNPFTGWFFKYMGGWPVIRKNNEKQVQSIANMFIGKKHFILAISPEGTRKKVQKWKTGFYYIAKLADVPIVMITLDYKNKENKISKPFFPTDDIDSDFDYLQSYFKGVEGKIPKYS